jgi:hypothetical protein
VSVPASDSPVSWLLIRRGWQVKACDGTVVGRIGAVRGEPVKGIFNGIVVRAESSPPRYLPAELVTRIVPGSVEIALNPQEFAAVAAEKKRPLVPSFSLAELLRRAGLR